MWSNYTNIRIVMKGKLLAYCVEVAGMGKRRGDPWQILLDMSETRMLLRPAVLLSCLYDRGFS